MGRYNRNRKRNGGSSGSYKKKEKSFNSVERDLLEAYLTYYHDAASRTCFPPDDIDSDDDETIRASNRQSTAFENDSTWIRGHEFQALKPDLLELPYLALPSTLSTNDRRILYELCIHTNLYHIGAGKKFVDRYSIVTPHPDGFDHVSGLDEPLEFPVTRCKPWFYRNDIGGVCPSPRQGMSFSSSYSFSPQFLSRHKVKETTDKHKVIIQDLMAYPDQCLRKADTAKKLSNPPIFDASHHTMTLIDTAEKMKKCVKEMEDSSITELGFDLEAYNASKYKQATCLIQLCTNLGQEYVIDVLAEGVWDEVPLLRPIFADKSIVKIGHGILGIDVPCLHRDFGIFIVNAFDTMEAANKLKMKNHLGLAKLCKYYDLEEDSERHSKLKDLYQTCDWRERPLKDDQLEYGVKDVRYLSQLRRLLLKDLLDYDSVPSIVPNGSNGNVTEWTRAGSPRGFPGREESANLSTDSCDKSEDDGSFFTAHDDNDAKTHSADDTEHSSRDAELRYNMTLMEALKISQQKCLSLWYDKSEPDEKNPTLIGLISRAKRLSDIADVKTFSDEDLSLYKELVEWRKDAAKKVGIMPSMLCDLDLLANVAYKRPGSLTSLKKVSYFLPNFFQEKENSAHLEDLFSVVAAAGNDSLANTDVIVRLYSERKIKKRPNQVPQHIYEVDDEKKSSAALPTDLNIDDKRRDTISNRSPPPSTSNAMKLTLTAAVLSAAVIGVKALKQRR